jgi:pyruvate/2-oxoglutarate dehydrogenase complex dihydrolipoamide dehydrogenase (E3) component
VVGAGPAGLAAAAEAGAAGHEVIVLEQAMRTCGQIALAGAAPGHAELLQSLRENYQRLLQRGGVDLRLNTKATPEAVARLEPDLVVVATGARPYEPPLPFENVDVEQAWRVIDGVVPREKRAVVADWGGDPAGLDAAEILDRAGNAVTLVVASVAAGEAVHQYRRNLYLARLYRAGVEIEHHLELVEAGAGTATFRNIFAPEVERTFPADVLVLALGRVPNDGLGEELRTLGLRVEEAGDCRSPRGLEEAILEGTLAVRDL